MTDDDVAPNSSSQAPSVPQVPPTRRDQRFRWAERLHERKDFSTVLRQGRRVQMSGLTLWVFRHPHAATPPRIGFAISRHYGNAVARNRLKRLLRETFRLNKHRLPAGLDFVFSARPMGTLKYQTIESLVLKLWTKADIVLLPSA